MGTPKHALRPLTLCLTFLSCAGASYKDKDRRHRGALSSVRLHCHILTCKPLPGSGHGDL